MNTPEPYSALPAVTVEPLRKRRQQLQFRRDHKSLCIERAIADCRYDDANIFCAQRDYIDREISRTIEVFTK